ncbi:ParA family protein [methanotrophic endosymbiont of Bathymodiolus puteoserpentis (Logatchev)]|jgi:chromosome partitioning protein|uniref:ParA family protein n=1 Tax=methanotrophic endosymbiont of Bathymodiolus puteoserpentis (Logatchev) TaxID=343235 RepID=UPI0013CCBFDF|nr:ParA family protein [methanotrophic endosymbiont of Bathymodiolus puteoserpentis (Logatchev)]SHE23625.1 Chromosome (plasmid) partitioning protein ParA [methanotrophic endosymbiont of Bathymodiolus puteoserpentis (Logatchev)]
MKIWSVSNQKGGVGKTTTVITLGGLLSSWGYRTLLVDLDPHGSLSSYFKQNPDETQASVYNLFHNASRKVKDYNPRPYIIKTEFENLSILPAATAIATLDRQVASLGGMGLVISSALAEVADEYDYVIIDSPPMLGVLMINALAACEYLLVPVITEFLALQGLDRMVRTIQMVYKSRKQAPGYKIIPTMYDKRTKAGTESLNFLRNKYPDNAWHSFVPVDTKLREASSMGVPASIYDPTSKAVASYSNLLDELLQKDKLAKVAAS